MGCYMYKKVRRHELASYFGKGRELKIIYSKYANLRLKATSAPANTEGRGEETRDGSCIRDLNTCVRKEELQKQQAEGGLKV